MTDQQHPITPPPELIAKWAGSMCGYYEAARWGADMELEACCEYMQHEDFHGFAKELRAARRPKPPSLKEQANSISFQEGPEVIRLDAKGFHYHGQFIEDAGEAHRLLVEFLRKHQPDSDWQHAK